MNKKYMAINALIICVGLGIILGLIYEKNSTKKENNTKEYNEKIEQLEKTIEEKNTKINELETIINASTRKDNKYQDIVDKVMDNYYKYSFYTHSSVYCGEHGENAEYKYIDKGKNIAASYHESYTFKNLKDVKEFFTKYLSEKYYNENIEKYYLENNNKVYCYEPGKGKMFYKQEESKFIILSSTDNKIEVYSLAIADNIGTSTLIKAHVTLIKENENWVVDEYNESN